MYLIKTIPYFRCHQSPAPDVTWIFSTCGTLGFNLLDSLHGNTAMLDCAEDTLLDAQSIDSDMKIRYFLDVNCSNQFISIRSTHHVQIHGARDALYVERGAFQVLLGYHVTRATIATHVAEVFEAFVIQVRLHLPHE